MVTKKKTAKAPVVEPTAKVAVDTLVVETANLDVSRPMVGVTDTLDTEVKTEVAQVKIEPTLVTGKVVNTPVLEVVTAKANVVAPSANVAHSDFIEEVPVPVSSNVILPRSGNSVDLAIYRGLQEYAEKMTPRSIKAVPVEKHGEQCINLSSVLNATIATQGPDAKYRLDMVLSVLESYINTLNNPFTRALILRGSSALTGQRGSRFSSFALLLVDAAPRAKRKAVGNTTGPKFIVANFPPKSQPDMSNFIARLKTGK